MLPAMFRYAATIGRWVSISVMACGLGACGDRVGFDAGWDTSQYDSASDVPRTDAADVRGDSPDVIDAPPDAIIDAGTDSTPEAAIDAARDVTADTSAIDARDVTADTPADTAIDGAADVRDATTETGTDASADVRVDAPADVGPDAGPPWRHTITIDGTNDFTAASESIPTTSTGYTAYVTWDATYLYVGYQGADVASAAVTRWVLVFLDNNPGAAGGATSSPTYNTEAVGFPAGFAPEFYLRWRASNDFQTLEQYAAGAWTTSTTVPQTFQTGTFVEFRIPLAAIGSPTRVGITTLMLNEAPGVEAAYAGLYAGNFTDGYHATVPVTAYLLADLASTVAPNSASNRR